MRITNTSNKKICPYATYCLVWVFGSQSVKQRRVNTKIKIRDWLVISDLF